jgi:hypothetical protein
MGYREISTLLYTWLGADLYLADRDILQMSVNREDSLQLRRTQIPAILNETGNTLFLHKENRKITHQDKVLCRAE